MFKSYPSMKVNTTLCEFIKESPVEENRITDIKYFNSKNVVINMGTHLNLWFQENVVDKILNKLEELNYFSLQDQLNNYLEYCKKLNDYKISFPKETKLYFKNYIHKETLLFIIYADFETCLEPYNGLTPKSIKYCAFSVGYYLKCSYDNSLSYYRSNRGPDYIEWFTN